MISTDPNVFMNLVTGAKVYAYDVETNGLDWRKCHVVGYSVSDGDTSCYVPVRHTNGGNIVDVDGFEKSFASELSRGNKRIIGHNIKFDLLFSLNHGVDLRANTLYCTMVTQALINERTPRFSLSELSRVYKVTAKKEAEIYSHIATNVHGAPNTREAMGYFHMLQGTDPIAIEYAAGDTLTTFELFSKQIDIIARQELGLVLGLEGDLTAALVDMERRGILVSREAVEYLQDKVPELEGEKRAALGDHWNMNIRSKVDLKDYFYNSDIDDWPVTEKGNPSFTTNYFMQTEVGQAVLEVKKLAHFHSAFLMPFINKHIQKGGTVHTSFNQVKTDNYGTVSGRLSSSNPNLQQVPKRDKTIGKMFRSMFIARPGYILAEMDYSQAEPRLYTHFSGEPKLVDGYNANPPIDMHAIVSSMMDIERDPAKVLNLAIMYSMGSTKLARSLNIEPELAGEYLGTWNRLFPRAKNYRRTATTQAEKLGYITTILGRRRRFPKGVGAYKAANAIVQGGSADILKWKMVEIARYIATLPAGTIYMLLNIHDAIVFEVIDNPEGQTALAECKRIMENVNGEPFRLTVPFIAGLKSGRTWSAATYD